MKSFQGTTNRFYDFTVSRCINELQAPLKLVQGFCQGELLIELPTMMPHHGSRVGESTTMMPLHGWTTRQP